MRHRFFLVVSIFATMGCTSPSAPARAVEFVVDVQPIFQKHCYSCHGPDKQKSGLRLDIKSEAFAGGHGWGSSIVAGSANESPLIELVTHKDPQSRMPPGGESLSTSEINTLVNWIDAGANWPDGVDQASVEDKLDHWSFQSAAASVDHDSIDRFIDESLAENGLKRNPPADPRTLVRRLFLDLTGLPPSIDDVDSFVQDPNVEKLVDQILASQHYGERWAQHWLDVIRWAETVGFETNLERKNAWPYRDWLIDAFNDDKPYDRFILEQIAGDTVGEDAALGFLVAGPANLPGQIGRDEAAMRGARQDELDEVIRTVSQAFLGLTVGCARCHDHKFDPIAQQDYYSMQAIFAGLRYGTRRWRGPTDDAWQARVPAAREKVASLQRRREELRRELRLRESLRDVQTFDFEPVSARSVRMRINATNNRSAASLYEFEVWSDSVGDAQKSKNIALASNGATVSASSFALANQSRHFDNLIDGSVDKRQSYPWVAKKSGPAWFQIDFDSPHDMHRIVIHRGSSMPVDFVIEVLPESSQDWQEIVHTHDRFPRTDDTRKASDIELKGCEQDDVKRITDLIEKIRRAQSELARLTAGPQVYAASFSPQPETTFVLHRGDAMQPRDAIAPAIPKFLGQLAAGKSSSESDWRVALAEQLTQVDHPLTARVMVNRIWQHHFGTGLVDTPSDLGRMGTAPSHPELLDWLASWFIANGWSIKKLHRLILTSQTYQQSSHPRARALAIDADTRLLWRYPPRRLEAEAIRDSILCVSGKLNLEAGGPGFDFFNQRGGLSDYRPKESFDESGWRRMIYAHKVRMVSVDVFGAFDCPDAGQMKPSRTRSITPIQSLGLFNSPFVNRQASFFAQRLQTEVPDDLDAQIDRAFLLAYSRNPTREERERLVDLAKNHGLTQVCRAIFNSSEFVFVQ